MAKKHWTIELEDGEHTVHLEYLRLSWQHCTLSIDGRTVDGGLWDRPGAVHENSVEHLFTIGTHICSLVIRTGFVLYYTPQLIVDGRSVSNARTLMPWGADGFPVRELLKRVRKAVEEGSSEAVRDAISVVEHRIENEDVSMQNHALRGLGEILAVAKPPCSVALAQACAHLMFHGADPHLVVDSLLNSVAETLLPARRHAQPALGEELHDDPGDFHVLDHRPEYGAARLAIGALCQAACVALARTEMRQLGRAHEALMARLAIEEFRAVGLDVDLLARVFEVLDGEEILVFHPSLRRGYRVWITGILDVDQLQTLLAAALGGPEDEGWLPGRVPEATTVALARDRVASEPVLAAAVWDLWEWSRLAPDETLPQHLVGSIRGGETPASIPTFEGVRVILLTPPIVARISEVRRALTLMQANLRVLEILDGDVVEDWLRRMASAATKV